MMFRHVMVPYDGSDHAKNALNYAKDLVAGDADAKLSVVHAVPSSFMGVDRMGTDGALDGVPYGMLDYEEYQGVVKRVLDEAQKRVAEDLGDALADLGDRAQVEAVAGASPADALSRYAEEHDCDLIVMGSRGFGTFRSMLVGSVSHYVLQQAHCPVLIVKGMPDDRDEEDSYLGESED